MSEVSVNIFNFASTKILKIQDLSKEHNMQLNQKMMMSLATIAVIMSVVIMGTNGQVKPIDCCTTVSTKEITLPITGFRLQKSNPPCINAVIFFTTEGQRCSHWKESWVKQKIQELKKIQLQEWAIKINSTDSTPLSTGSPYNSTSA